MEKKNHCRLCYVYVETLHNGVDRLEVQTHPGENDEPFQPNSTDACQNTTEGQRIKKKRCDQSEQPTEWHCCGCTQFLWHHSSDVIETESSLLTVDTKASSKDGSSSTIFVLTTPTHSDGSYMILSSGGPAERLDVQAVLQAHVFTWSHCYTINNSSPDMTGSVWISLIHEICRLCWAATWNSRNMWRFDLMQWNEEGGARQGGPCVTDCTFSSR